MDNLAELKAIYLSEDIDSDDYQDNLDKITEWETILLANEERRSWQEHDITKRVISQASESYTDISIRLATERDITPEKRTSLYAKQDAMLWIMNLSYGDPKAVIKDIEKKIRIAINTTK